MSIDLDVAQAQADLYSLATNTRAYVAYVRSCGIDPWGVVGSAGGTALLPIYDCGFGRFDFAPHLNCPDEPFDGFVAEVLDADGETTIDLVAWSVSSPARVYTMFGRAPAVGLWNAHNYATYYMGKSLRLHRTPLEWIQSGCDGAAIIDAGLAARWLIDLPGPVAARDEVHAHQIFKLMQSVVDRTKIVVAVPEPSRNQQQQVAA